MTKVRLGFKFDTKNVVELVQKILNCLSLANSSSIVVYQYPIFHKKTSLQRLSRVSACSVANDSRSYLTCYLIREIKEGDSLCNRTA